MIAPWQTRTLCPSTSVQTEGGGIDQVTTAKASASVVQVVDFGNPNAEPNLVATRVSLKARRSGTSTDSESDSEAAVAPEPTSGRRTSGVVISGSGRRIALNDDDIADNPLIRLLMDCTTDDFDVEALVPFTAGQPLLCLSVYFCNCYFLVEALELELPLVQKFMLEVEASYRPLPYHSSLHAADVVLSAVRLLKFSRFPVMLTSLELLAVITACAGTSGDDCVTVVVSRRGCFVTRIFLSCVRNATVHDVDHPGVNNAFISSTNHDIALQHNDQ
jgi:hypothetical protein